MLSSRQRNIMKHLLGKKEYTAIADLAQRFHISTRSIQYDIENMEYYAKKHGARLFRNKRLGIQLSCTPEFEEQFANDRHDGWKVNFSSKERREKILIKLFESLQPISSGKLAGFLYVSRRTIVEDLKDVEAWLADRSLQLKYVQNKGFTILGDEKKYRESYVEVLGNHYQSDAVDIGIQVLEKNEIALVRRSVHSALEKELNYNLVQTALDGLVYHIAISLHRMRNHFQIEMPEKEWQRLKDHKEYAIAKRIQKQVEENFGITFPKYETGYITLHLLGAKQGDLEFEQDLAEEDNLAVVLDEFIRQVSGYMGVDLTDDPTLLKGLFVHMKPALYRLKFQMRNKNPLKKEIQDRFPNVISAIYYNLSAFDVYDVPFNDDEIAYMALHIGSAIERKFERTRYVLNVLIVCASGVGTSQLLKSKIENYYPELRICAASSVYKIDADYIKENQIDFVITTVAMDDAPIPVIRVSPFLTKEDRTVLNEFLNEEREKAIESGLSSGPTLRELLAGGHVRWNVSADKWEDAIAASVQPLITDGLVTASYEKAILEQFHEHGPYMVIDDGVALPHAAPEHGVKHTGFSFIKLKEPVHFGHSRHDPVEFVICLATANPHIHLNALHQLTMILQDGERMERLRNAANKDDLLQMIDEVSG